MKTYWRIIPFVVFISLTIFLWRGLSLEPSKLPSVKIGHVLPNFRLKELHNKLSMLTPETLKNHAYLIVFWASWCQACIEEQDFLLNLANNAIPIIGINYKDDSEDARRWLVQWGNPYRYIGIDKQGKLAMDLGVYGAPEVFLVDKVGIIRYRHVGILNEKIWQEEFQRRFEPVKKV